MKHPFCPEKVPGQRGKAPGPTQPQNMVVKSYDSGANEHRKIGQVAGGGYGEEIPAHNLKH